MPKIPKPSGLCPDSSAHRAENQALAEIAGHRILGADSILKKTAVLQ
ncbi:MAG: hypothetical protein ACRDA8_08520 [Shewanella sp.]